jgi:Major Facilitator Superfamily
MNVTIAQWFVRKRGRAMGIANLGTGVAKFTIPLCAASLFVLVGWRSTWAIFGIVAPLLVVVPALIFMHRRPEDIGLRPDGEPPLPSLDKLPATNQTPSTKQRRTLPPETSWNRSEVIRLPTFWLLVVTFGIAGVGIAGLNLHIFSYVTDIGYSPLIAASFMSTIALTQLGSTVRTVAFLFPSIRCQWRAVFRFSSRSHGELQFVVYDLFFRPIHVFAFDLVSETTAQNRINDQLPEVVSSW